MQHMRQKYIPVGAGCVALVSPFKPTEQVIDDIPLPTIDFIRLYDSTKVCKNLERISVFFSIV